MLLQVSILIAKMEAVIVSSIAGAVCYCWALWKSKSKNFKCVSCTGACQLGKHRVIGSYVGNPHSRYSLTFSNIDESCALSASSLSVQASQASLRNLVDNDLVDV